MADYEYTSYLRCFTELSAHAQLLKIYNNDASHPAVVEQQWAQKYCKVKPLLHAKWKRHIRQCLIRNGYVPNSQQKGPININNENNNNTTTVATPFTQCSEEIKKVIEISEEARESYMYAARITSQLQNAALASVNCAHIVDEAKLHNCHLNMSDSLCQRIQNEAYKCMAPYTCADVNTEYNNCTAKIKRNSTRSMTWYIFNSWNYYTKLNLQTNCNQTMRDAFHCYDKYYMYLVAGDTRELQPYIEQIKKHKLQQRQLEDQVLKNGGKMPATTTTTRDTTTNSGSVSVGEQSSSNNDYVPTSEELNSVSEEEVISMISPEEERELRLKFLKMQQEKLMREINAGGAIIGTGGSDDYDDDDDDDEFESPAASNNNKKN